MRSLSKSEYDEAEATKTKIFLSLEPMESITEDIVLLKLNTVNSIDNNIKSHKYNQFLKSISGKMSRPLTTEELKYTKAYFYQMVYIPE